MAYDRDRNKVVLHGGVVLGDPPPPSDTWEFDGGSQTWTLRAHGPSRSGIRILMYDSARKRVIGIDTIAETIYEWDGVAATWSVRATRSGSSAWPPRRSNFGVAFDDRRGRMVLFGGSSGFGPTLLNDLWEWDNNMQIWIDRTPPQPAPSWPMGRAGHKMTYDSSRGIVVVFSGTRSFLQPDSGRELWEWNGTNGTWANRTPSVLPVAWPQWRTAFSLIFDERRQRVLMFGGNAGTFSYDDMWEWESAGGTWTRRLALYMGPTGPTAFSPGSREEHGMVWDAARGKAVLFGGRRSDGSFGVSLFGDTLEYDGTAGGVFTLDPGGTGGTGGTADAGADAPGSGGAAPCANVG